jgi:phosphoesterase RecJ-like protein
MLQKIADIFRTGDRFLVVSHVNPDGDAVGSLLGLCQALHEMGKQAWALSGDKLPETYDFLPGSGDVVTDPAEISESIAWIVSVDVAARDRISGDLEPFKDTARLINIDHHPTNPGFGDLNFIEPAMTSTAEVIFKVLKQAGYDLSKGVAKCLYTGLITDTGGFRFAGVGAQTLKSGAEMLGAGLDSYEVTRHLYEEFPLSRLQLERLVLERLEILLNGRLMVSTLLSEDFQRLGADFSEGENLVNLLRQCRGVEVGVLLTGMSDSLIRVSLRSKGRVDVSLIARSMGGGGHRHASGLKSSLPINELKQRIIDATAAALD